MKALPALITVLEAADRLGIRETDVLQLIQDDVLPSFRLGNQIRVLENDVLEYLRAIGRTDGKPIESTANLPLISTRYPIVIQWLKTRFNISGVCKERPTKADVMGRRCYGEIVPYLAVLAEVWYRIEVPMTVLNDPKTTLDQLDRAGCKLVNYTISIKEIVYPAGFDPRDQHLFIETVNAMPAKPNGNGNGAKKY